MTDAKATSPLGTAAAEHYTRVLRAVYEGRKWMLFGGPVAGLLRSARTLRSLGAAGTFLLADGMGTGDAPTPEDGPFALLPSGGDDIVDAMRRAERELLRLPPEVQAALDAWDPAREARGYGSFTLTGIDAIGGRRRFAARPVRWAALEDKVEVDAFWDAAGVRRAPSEIVAAEAGALRAAARHLDRGLGTAWAGDAREGLHGGAVCLRWVRTAEDAADAEAFFAARCNRVRVMPFLEGIPCSIHGLVFPGGGTAVFRPVEMVTLRRPGSNRLVYAGAATWWDPPPADREAMRAVGRRAAETLRDRVGYLGGFTVDGVLSEEAFLPTELNARLGAGNSLLAASLPALPFTPLALAAAEGLALDWRPELLESALVEAADARRQGGAWTVFPGNRAGTERLGLVEERGSLRPAREGETATAAVLIGPSPAGAFVRITPSPEAFVPGPPVGGWAVRAYAATDAHFGTAVGPIEAARDVRAG